MKFLKTLSVYTFSNFFNSGVSFLMLPIITVYLTPKDYGYLSIVTPIIAFTLPFISILSSGAIQQAYYEKDFSDLRLYISSSYKNSIISLCGTFLVFMLAFVLFRNWIDIPNYWFLIIPFLAFGQITSQIVLVIFQSMKKAYSYALFNISSALINMGLGILFIVVLKMSWQGRVIGWGISYLIFTIIGLIILDKQKLLTVTVNKKFQFNLLKFGLPLIPHSVGAVILNLSDRFFIVKMVSIEELGMYNIGYQIAMVIGILSSSFVTAYVPKLYEALKTNTLKSKVEIVKLSYLFIIVLIVIIVLLYLVTPIIFDLFIGDLFKDGAKYVFWISISYLFLSMYKMVAGIIFYYKKTKYFTYLSLINISINIVLNYFFIRKYGALGAAYATIISNLVLFILTALISYKVKKMPWFTFLTNNNST